MRSAVVCALVIGCARNPPAEAPFTANGVEGAFALLDLTNDHLETVGDVDVAYAPGATFAIARTLIALNTAVDEEALGDEHIKTHLRQFEYGNQTSAELRISPRQQTVFLERLRRRKLPILQYAFARHVLRDLPREESGGFLLRAKCGTVTQDQQAIGWVVGYVDRGTRSWAFATLVRAQKGEESRLARVRVPIAKALLARYGAWPRP